MHAAEHRTTDQQRGRAAPALVLAELALPFPIAFYVLVLGDCAHPVSCEVSDHE